MPAPSSSGWVKGSGVYQSLGNLSLQVFGEAIVDYIKGKLRRSRSESDFKSLRHQQSQLRIQQAGIRALVFRLRRDTSLMWMCLPLIQGLLKINSILSPNLDLQDFVMWLGMSFQKRTGKQFLRYWYRCGFGNKPLTILSGREQSWPRKG